MSQGDSVLILDDSNLEIETNKKYWDDYFARLFASLMDIAYLIFNFFHFIMAILAMIIATALAVAATVVAMAITISVIGVFWNIVDMVGAVAAARASDDPLIKIVNYLSAATMFIGTTYYVVMVSLAASALVAGGASLKVALAAAILAATPLAVAGVGVSFAIAMFLSAASEWREYKIGMEKYAKLTTQRTTETADTWDNSPTLTSVAETENAKQNAERHLLFFQLWMGCGVTMSATAAVGIMQACSMCLTLSFTVSVAAAVIASFIIGALFFGALFTFYMGYSEYYKWKGAGANSFESKLHGTTAIMCVASGFVMATMAVVLSLTAFGILALTAPVSLPFMLAAACFVFAVIRFFANRINAEAKSQEEKTLGLDVDSRSHVESPNGSRAEPLSTASTMSL